MLTFINYGFAAALAIWTFVMGVFYGLVNFGGDFIQWLNAAFFQLSPDAFGMLVGALQSAGAVICFIIWVCGVATLAIMYKASSVMFGPESFANRRAKVMSTNNTIDSTAREL